MYLCAMNNLNGIKNLVFDLGGVLLNIDFKQTYDAFERLGIPGAHAINERPEVWQLFMDLEVGKYTEGEFLAAFRQLAFPGPGVSRPMHGDGLRPDISDDQIIAAFNALLLDYPADRIALVQELGKRYRTFLLSNTNAIHARCYNARLKADFGIENLDHLLGKAYYSHELGYRKPDKRIYTKALELSGIRPEETLFFDDNQENVEAARGVGIGSVLVSEEFSFVDFFRTLPLLGE